MFFICSEIARAPEEHGVEEYRFNDGKISPGGVFIGGRMHKTGAEVDGKHSHWYKLQWHKEPGKSRLVQVVLFGLILLCSAIVQPDETGRILYMIVCFWCMYQQPDKHPAHW